MRSSRHREERSAETQDRLSVVVACPGLDHVGRGYERFAAQLAAALEQFDDFQVRLAKGSGSAADGQLVLRAPDRNGRAVGLMTAMVGGRSRTTPEQGGRAGLSLTQAVSLAMRRRLPLAPYEVEASVFGARLALWVRRNRPDVVVVQDVPVAKVLAAALRRSGASTRVLFVNGAPWPPPYDFAHSVIHLTPDSAAAAGRSPGPWRDHLLPCAVEPPADGRPRDVTRRQLGIPVDAFVVLSVGALNDHHKRHITTIREVAALESAHLIIAGASDPQEPLVRRAADTYLPGRTTIGPVDPAAINDLFAASDAYVLASTVEGFGLASVEAAMAGLPVLVHDGTVQRSALEDAATYVDTNQAGAITAALRRVRDGASTGAQHEAAARLRQRLSWEALAGDYAEVVRRTAAAADDL